MDAHLPITLFTTLVGTCSFVVNDFQLPVYSRIGAALPDTLVYYLGTCTFVVHKIQL